MANRKRNIQMKFYVTEEEKQLIEQKMQQLPTQRYGAYLRKMAIDGYIINMDTTDIKAFTAAQTEPLDVSIGYHRPGHGILSRYQLFVNLHYVY